MLTPGQVSDLLKVSPSTIRRWSVLFEDHLSKRTTKHRQYSPEDFDTLKRIRDLSSEGIELDEIRRMVGVVVQQQENQNKGLMVYEDFVELLDSFRFTTNTMQQQIDELKAQVAYLSLPWWKRKRK